jgi:ATP-dependent protease ClpP protease subunit
VYLTAQQAVEYGLIDGILQPSRKGASSKNGSKK